MTTPHPARMAELHPRQDAARVQIPPGAIGIAAALSGHRDVLIRALPGGKVAIIANSVEPRVSLRDLPMAIADDLGLDFIGPTPAPSATSRSVAWADLERVRAALGPFRDLAAAVRHLPSTTIVAAMLRESGQPAQLTAGDLQRLVEAVDAAVA